MGQQKNLKPTFNPSLSAVVRKLELPGDALLLVYFAVLVRQYLWWLADRNGLAWIVATLTAALVWWFYVSTKEAAKAGAALPFWLVAIAPLVFVYSMRFVFPDVSFDVLNYRLLHSERALHGFLYLPGEFFPTPAPYNPAPDMVTGIFRHLLGYRLGTIVNLMAMIWVARITDKLLRPFWPNPWLRAVGVLLALMAEHLLFEINNYMADLLALPLLLEATYLALRRAEWKSERRNLICIALLLGMSVAFKLTNAAVALPVVLLCGYQVVKEQSRNRSTVTSLRELAFITLLCATVFFLPLIPFSAYLYRETGSVFFPVFNAVFKSVYWPLSNVWDPRWGPRGLWEKLAWPILITFYPARLSELLVYSGRISFGFVAGLIGLVVVRRQPQLRELCFIVVTAALLWSASTGYIRYALYVEVLSAVVVLALSAGLAKLTRQASPTVKRAGVVAACLLVSALMFQAYLAVRYTAKQEWAGRPTFFTQPGPSLRDVRYLLRDRSLRDFLSPQARAQFDKVEVWIVSSIKTSGLEMMLQPQAPMIGVNNEEYFVAAAGKVRYSEALKQVAGRRMFTLAFFEDLGAAKAALKRHGLAAGEVLPVQIPFYSPHAVISAYLIEIELAPDTLVTSQSDISNDAQGPQPDATYSAAISAVSKPAVMQAGEKQELRFKVRNTGSFVWPSRSPQGWLKTVSLGDRWLTAHGEGVVNDLDGRTTIPHDLKPGDETEVRLTVKAPQRSGDYVLEIDVIHEGVTWFYQRGSKTLRWPVKVGGSAQFEK